MQRDYRFEFAVSLNKHQGKQIFQKSKESIGKIYTLDWSTPFRHSLYYTSVKIAVMVDTVSCAVYFAGGARLHP